MIYRFRVVLDNDTKEDVFRDIEIRKTDSLEDLHNVITQSFGFDGSEMASFLRLGILDGVNGWRICKQTFIVTFLKYYKIRKLWHNSKRIRL